MKPAMLRFSSGVLFLLAGAAYAQNAGQPSSKSEPVYRLPMTECQSDQINDCVTWSFLSSNGWKGSGKWRTGEEAFLEIKGVKNGIITIDRTDVTGSRAGLTATYTGTLHEDRITGEFQFHYQGRDGSGSWYATLGAPAPTLPPAEFHFCGAFCNTWRLENGRYVNTTTCGNFRAAGASVITIEKFARESVVLHRADYPPNQSYTATYTGQVSGDGNNLVNAAIDGTPQPFRVTWGAALNSIPGCGNWNAQAAPQITAGDFIEGVKFFNTLAEAVEHIQRLSGQR